MDDHRIKAVAGGNRLGFRCENCGAESELFKPYRPDADATDSVATPNGANGNGHPNGASKARQAGRKSGRRGWPSGIQYGRGKRKAVPGMTGKRADGG